MSRPPGSSAVVPFVVGAGRRLPRIAVGLALLAPAPARGQPASHELTTVLCDDSQDRLEWLLRWERRDASIPLGSKPATGVLEGVEIGPRSGCQEWRGFAFRGDWAPELVGGVLFDEFYIIVRHLAPPHGEGENTELLALHLNANLLRPTGGNFAPVPAEALAPLPNIDASLGPRPPRTSVAHVRHLDAVSRFEVQTIPATGVINFRIIAIHAIPEPATVGLTAVGLLVVGVAARRRRRVDMPPRPRHASSAPDAPQRERAIG